MFDKTIVHTAPSSVNITKHEHRAPTDDSIRLLREMEQKVKDSVTKSVQVKNNQFFAVVHHMTDHLSCLEKYMVIFEMNGKKVTVECGIDNFSSNLEGTLLTIRDAVAKEISNHILGDVFKELPDA